MNTSLEHEYKYSMRSLEEGRSSNSKIALKSRVHIASNVTGENKIARKLHFFFFYYDNVIRCEA